MKNERGAGRKPKITEQQFEEILSLVSKGESVTELAAKYGISRQAIYQKMKKRYDNKSFVLDYMIDEVCVSQIEVDMKAEAVRVYNYATKLSLLPFGVNTNPSWEEFCLLLVSEYLKAKGLNEESDYRQFFVQDMSKTDFSIEDLVKHSKARISMKKEDLQSLPLFHINKKDLLTARTDTDGFQMKSVSKDRKWFIKAQAMISGEYMDDWAVELIATSICKQLGIPHVEQHRCQISYGGRILNGVYARNFELDGYCFISFERLLERMGTSSREKEFIKLDSIEKLKWCAKKLSEAGNISYKKTLRYMIDLALVDCLVGNVDRHTKNYGLFYNVLEGDYEIPLIFDNGMGLFEHDGYKKQYEDFNQAMMTVYVSPYGEDPFDMIQMLDKEFDLLKLYPGLKELKIQSEWMTPFAKEYIERMLSIWQK